MKKIVAISLIILLTTSVFAQWPYDNKPIMGTPINWAHPLGDPVGFWYMPEGSGNKTFDLSGNENTGTIINSVWAPGKFGMCWEGDGVADDYINFGNKAIINTMGPMSVSAWIYPHDLGEGNLGRIFDKRGAGAPKDGWVLLLGGANYMYTVIDFDTTELRAYTTDNAITMNAWNHIVMTWDGSTTSTNVHLYVNGVETAYQNAQNGVGARDSDAANDLYLGNSGDLDRCFDGLIDVPILYNRVLTASEITELYSTPFCMFEADDVALMALEAPSGQIIIISSVIFEGFGFFGLLLLLSWLIKKGLRA